MWWLGGDLGQFIGSFFVRRDTLSPDARIAVARLMVAIDVGPKICLVLMLPVALSLAVGYGALQLAAYELAGVWAFTAIWLPTVVWLHFRPGKGSVYRTLDLWFRLLLIGALVVVAVISLTGDGPVAVDFVSYKMLLYALAIAGGVGIRLTITGFGPALGRLATEGSSPAVEAQIAAALRPAYWFVGLIWAALITATVVGVVKPS